MTRYINHLSNKSNTFIVKSKVVFIAALHDIKYKTRKNKRLARSSLVKPCKQARDCQPLKYNNAH